MKTNDKRIDFDLLLRSEEYRVKVVTNRTKTIAEAAKQLGVSERTLYRLRKKYNVDKKPTSVVEVLINEKEYYITLISMLTTELVHNKIITPTQRKEVHTYILNKIKK